MKGSVGGKPPQYRAAEEYATMMGILRAHESKLIQSCNNVGRGGLAIALMKMILDSKYGFGIDLNTDLGEAGSFGEKLFSESSTRYIVEIDTEDEDAFRNLMSEKDVPLYRIGKTNGKRIADFGVFQINVDEALEVFDNGLKRYME
jgi:phosphoribosylformylglycinamidine synthase